MSLITGVSLSCTPSVSVIFLYPKCQCHYPVTPSVSVIILYPECQCHYPVPRKFQATQWVQVVNSSQKLN
ncbi:unnamed protein product [Ranitomeya imitator]|uniref:Secreted protein n=1 Tax=Ranitomeya imitator TaxID=111125 RepID=A0ABN9KR84_9NEOB|nr:unnamed protein product [Ranitomeya imitator]